ncbi:MAG TPA: formyltransferase family protein [Flavobacterium sp.]|jgi:methionyl-tRNA formyltransferase|nr:formyltransferase family protein [Flavobacterium sp.]HPJ10963.1 formyltransferase family protein [Flavobacterium sp.]
MINIFVIGKKGLDSVTGISTALYPKINAIIIGKDSGVVNDYSDAIEQFARQNNISYFFRTQTDEKVLAKATLNIAIGWRWLIALDVPLVVFHDSILPQYRGFNPLVSALINGDSRVGVTALMGTDEFDKGDIIGQRTIAIQYPIKIATAIDRLAKEYALLLEEVISASDGTLSGTPQNESEASFSLWRDDEDYQIDWQQDAQTIKRMIDAVGFPYKGAATRMDGTLVRIFDADCLEEVNIVNRAPGKVLFKHADGLVIVCGSGLLKVKDFYGDDGEKLEVNKFRIRFK